MDTPGIGRRIAYHRSLRGLSQADFGRLMGQTKRWVQDLEGGKRQQDPRLSVLVRAADVLRVPLEQLVTGGFPELPADGAPPPETRAVIDALYQPLPDADPPAPADLRRRLVYCCRAFQACHYASLARELPALIVGAGQAAHAAPAGRQSDAQALLSRVYQLATSYLHKYGAPTAIPAALAADRALAAGERSGDPVQIGAAARRVVKSLVHQRRAGVAERIATDTARRLSDDLTERGPLGMSTLGMLCLSAALAASSQERTAVRVRDANGYVDEARELAERQGGDRDEDFTMFGPTNVLLHRIDMLTRLDDGWSALEAAEGLDPVALAALSRERQAGHFVTLARASLQARRKDAAAEAVMAADRLAPEEVRGRPDAVNLVKLLVSVVPRPSWQLRELAGRCGLRA